MAVAAADPRPMPPSVTVTYRAAITPRGEAARKLYPFVHALKGLSTEDREYVLAMLAEEVADLTA